MIKFLEKYYILFRLIQIAKQNKRRNLFYKKFNFDDYGEDLENAALVRAKIDSKGLMEKSRNYYSASNKIQKDDFGIREYVQQTAGYCEDDFHGVIYRKTPIKNLFIRTYFDF